MNKFSSLVLAMSLVTAPAKVVENYRAFVEWQVEHKGMTIERFQPGRRDQVVLLRDTGRYPDFELRNIMANG